MNPVAELRGVTKRYAQGRRSAAVSDVSFRVSEGELVVLLGPSGSGKTTVLQLLAGLLEPTEGTVHLFGTATAGRRPKELQRLRATSIGFVFQNFRLLDPLTALQNAMIVAEFAGCGRLEASRRALGALRSLGIAHLAGRYPATLSQGEQQRVAVGRAIVNDARLLLADEPTASLESAQGAVVLDILRTRAREQGCAVVLATHDQRCLAAADRVIRLLDGKLTDDERPGSVVAQTSVHVGASTNIPEPWIFP